MQIPQQRDLEIWSFQLRVRTNPSVRRTLGNFRNYWNPMITRLLPDVSCKQAKEANVFRQKDRIINPLPRSTY